MSPGGYALELDGCVALVTGAGRGIGRSVALALARRGAQIAVNDLDGSGAEATAAQVSDLKSRALVCQGDVSDPAQVEHMVQAAMGLTGQIHILVNNAGIGGRGHTILEVTVEEWDRMLDVDLKSVFLCCRTVAPIMVRQGFGKIISVSSVFGVSGAAGSVPYSAAKAGVIGLSKALAREMARYGINVNVVAPGLIDTDMSRARGTLDRPNVPWPRMGEPQDVAELVAFLASPQAEFITGQVISPNGGSHI
jgi:3-oxoacyl-[acyl-carrier protein] reductase